MSRDAQSHKAELLALCNALIDSPAMANKPHGLLLEALLTTFAVMAEQHPCCAAHNAQECARVAVRLYAAAAATQVPAGASVH